jgi:hypothetical protein
MRSPPGIPRAQAFPREASRARLRPPDAPRKGRATQETSGDRIDRRMGTKESGQSILLSPFFCRTERDMDCGSLLPLSGGQPAGRRMFQDDVSPRRARVCGSGGFSLFIRRLWRQQGCLGKAAAGCRSPCSGNDTATSSRGFPATPRAPSATGHRGNCVSREWG